jgi:hypothetical protein
MGTISEVLDRTVDLHPDPSNEQLESTLDGLHQLLSELERPQNRELIFFVRGWQELEKEIDKLQRKIQERMAEKPANKVNEFLQQLKKKQ